MSAELQVVCYVLAIACFIGSAFLAHLRSDRVHDAVALIGIGLAFVALVPLVTALKAT